MRAVRRAACLLLCVVAAAGVAYAGAPAVDAVLVLVVAGFGFVIVRVGREIREQQRRIIRQLEVQTLVIHNAARLAAERLDESKEG
ncbi:hypothetical protein ACGFNU_27675 [Spirillospora sp. NPDC048911]|uniref:hypothetical protein n=1 Tax=Spirillospora sp. NPDC048911 TaxID=3364527 RepID=UPI00372233B3